MDEKKLCCCCDCCDSGVDTYDTFDEVDRAELDLRETVLEAHDVRTLESFHFAFEHGKPRTKSQLGPSKYSQLTQP